MAFLIYYQQTLRLQIIYIYIYIYIYEPDMQDTAGEAGSNS